MIKVTRMGFVVFSNYRQDLPSHLSPLYFGTWGKQITLGMKTSEGWILVCMADNSMGCDKENEQHKTKTYVEFFIWKGFRKHSPQRKVIADKDFCLQKCEMPKKGKNHCFCSSHFISYWSECCNFHGTRGKQRSK